jgi:spore maturation protein CgeB
VRRGHDVHAYEPADAWSVQNLVRDHGTDALDRFTQDYPRLRTTPYTPGHLDLDAALADVDLVLVHEWNDPALVAAIGRDRERRATYRAYFHDTHHRAVTDPAAVAAFDLGSYDGVLAFGRVLRDKYLDEGWARRAWVWHEAADPERFRPLDAPPERADLAWVGNWGDEERTRELHEFLLQPARDLRLTGTVHGVRYPPQGMAAVEAAGLRYGGWVANADVPAVYARHRATIHVPRRPYLRALPGIPTIRIFEALACGIPLIVARWRDSERLFTPGRDFLRVDDGDAMRDALRGLLDDPNLARRLAESGRRRILARHTCAHRAEELLAIDQRLRGVRAVTTAPAPGPSIAFFGSSLLSSYWNGAATYYRGLLRALAGLGCHVTFYEPDAFDRQNHRDLDPPPWARVVVWPNGGTAGLERALKRARSADILVKASGVGLLDDYLERRILEVRRPGQRVVYWDVDAPATLDRLRQDPRDPLRALIPRFDHVFTYGGGPPVVRAYKRLGAATCVPIYNGVDADEHYPVPPTPQYASDLSLLANRLPDREARVDAFFFHAARALPSRRFLLGGAGWDDKPVPSNVQRLGHVGTRDHNAFNASALAVLNVNRTSMARTGWSPPTRVFEATGAGACLITDDWTGLDEFLEPGREVLVARDGDDVARHLERLTPEAARAIGERALARVRRDHTYAQRAREVLRALDEPVPEAEVPAT